MIAPEDTKGGLHDNSAIQLPSVLIEKDPSSSLTVAAAIPPNSVGFFRSVPVLAAEALPLSGPRFLLPFLWPSFHQSGLDMKVESLYFVSSTAVRDHQSIPQGFSSGFHLRTPKVSSMMASIDEDVEKSSLADQDDVGSGLQRVTPSSRSSRSSDHRQPSPRQGRDNRDYDIKRSRYESSRRTPGIAHLQIGGYLVETMSDDNFVLEKGFSFFCVKDFPGK
ncbi:hypothetical protein Tco_0175049 [Tanacetum coccineum]